MGITISIGALLLVGYVPLAVLFFLTSYLKGRLRWAGVTAFMSLLSMVVVLARRLYVYQDAAEHPRLWRDWRLGHYQPPRGAFINAAFWMSMAFLLLSLVLLAWRQILAALDAIYDWILYPVVWVIPRWCVCHTARLVNRILRRKAPAPQKEQEPTWGDQFLPR